MVRPLLLEGRLQEAASVNTFTAWNPHTGQAVGEQYPIVGTSVISRAAAHAHKVFLETRRLPGSVFADFLAAFARHVTLVSQDLYAAAALETGLPLARFQNTEGPRLITQIGMGVAAAKSGDWRARVIDTAGGNNIRSEFVPFGPQLCIGPNNFPLAFNGVAGGEAVAAFVTGCPIIALGHRGHPRTTELLAMAAEGARLEVGLPDGFVQVLYGVGEDSWPSLIKAPGLGRVNFTGSRKAGQSVINNCAEIGRPCSVEMGSHNAVFVMDSALDDPDQLAKLIGDSVLLGTGQFCTKSGLIILIAGDRSNAFRTRLKAQFESAQVGPLLTESTRTRLASDITVHQKYAQLLCGGRPMDKPGFFFEPTILEATGTRFLTSPLQHQLDLFGPVTELVFADDVDQMLQIAATLEGSLTGGIFTGDSDADSRAVYDALTLTMGRPLVNKVTTGVTPSPAMAHTGPWPATGNSCQTSVGIPRSVMGRLICYDNVPSEFLPA